MAQVAICPNCEFEFEPQDNLTGGDVADCPSCGVAFLLPDDFAAPDKSHVDDEDADIIEPPGGFGATDDVTERRIEKWFRSAETVPDVPPVPIDLDAEEFSAEENDAADEFPLDDSPLDLAADVAEPVEHARDERDDLDEQALAHKQTVAMPVTAGADEQESDEIELVPPEPLPDSSATWEDSERMERLLADVEAKGVDDYLPVSREPRSAEDRTATLEYSAADREELGLDVQELTGQEANAAEASTDTAEEASGDEFTVVPVPRPRRRKSALRALVGTVLAGVIGLPLGYLVLLWLRGSAGDFLQMAQYFPDAVLPASLRADSPTVSSERMSVARQTTEPRAPAPLAGVKEDEALPLPTGAMPEAGASTDAGVKQASLDAPPAPAADKSSPLGERYAPSTVEAAPPTAMNTLPAESAKADELIITPPATSAPFSPSIAGAPTYSADQFAESLRAARDAQPGLVAGDLNDVAVQRTKGLSYSRLCDLAEMATFVGGGAANDPADAERTAAVEQLFRETLADPRIRGEVARIAPVWIKSAHRRHGGVFFAGAITDRVERGSLVECQIDLGTVGPLTVLVPKRLVDQLGWSRSVGVVGSLIDRPAERIAGYQGPAMQVVWAKSLIPLGP
jgi:hypothetical protein